MALVLTPRWVQWIYRRFLWLLFKVSCFFRWLVIYLRKTAAALSNKATTKIAALRKRYHINRANSIKDEGDKAFAERRFEQAVKHYEQVLDYLRQSCSAYRNSPKMKKLNSASLFAMAAIHAKVLQWDVCTAKCRNILRNGAKLQFIFQMMHELLNEDETTKLLRLLDEAGCTEFRGCTFDVASIRGYQYQKGKCCAAASIAGGLNTIFGTRHFSTNQALQTYIDLYPKYRAALEKRSTKHIGNANLRQGIQTLCQKQLDLVVELEILISGPRTKRRGFYVVQKSDLNVDAESKQGPDLDKYVDLLKAYILCKEHVLLAHVRNHYCLVFALRLNEDGSHDVLISKRGQTPKDWVSMKSFLMIFAKSKIYKLFAAKQRNDLI